MPKTTLKVKWRLGAILQAYELIVNNITIISTIFTAVQAAHCCTENDALKESVFAGHLDRFNFEKRVSIPIISYRIHSEFNSTTLNNDFCLLKLAKKLEYSDSIQPICLPASGDLVPPSQGSDLDHVR